MKYAVLASLSLLALSACSSDSVKDTLGLDRAAPDEFRVVSRPPLSVPPQFTLRPPTDEDVSPNQLASDRKAQALLAGRDVTDAGGVAAKPDTAVMPVAVSNEPAATPADLKKKKPASKAPQPTDTVAESQFLRHAGSDSANPNIRSELTEERYADQEKKAEQPWWQVWDKEDSRKEPTVDAKKEAERIQKNEDAGKSVTEGDTPEVKPKEKGILSGIFGND